MKYCMKCGTLLEDNHDICIGCGAEVTEPGTYSLYPPAIAKDLEKARTEEKKRGGTIALLIVVFVLLVAAITAFILINASSFANNEELDIDARSAEEALDTYEQQMSELEAEAEDKKADAAASEDAEGTASLNTDLISGGETTDSAADDAAADPNAPKTVKDAKGSYLIYTTVEDAAGNTIFSTLYPEDFNPVASAVNYDIYSSKFPESLTFIVANKDNNVKFTYLSPQHFWHRDSKNGKSRYNERNVKDYMQYLTYSKAEGYIDALIKQSYTDIKGFKLVNTKVVDEDMLAALEEFSGDYTTKLAGMNEDYAKIGDDTSYAAMGADFEANIFSYEATTRQNNTIYMDFYVPMLANTFSYASSAEDDMGNVTEWFPLEVIAFEAGNEELHDMYKDAFESFIYNSRLSKEFFYDNEQYSNEINSALANGRLPDALLKNKLKAYHDDYSSSTELDDFYKGIYKFISSQPKSYINFKNDEMSIISPSNIKVAFYNKENKRVFISPASDEYPGDQYSELQAPEGAISDSESEEDDAESSPSGGVS